MKRPRVYVDTSVYGGVFDDEFKDVSGIFFSQVQKGTFLLVTSPTVKNEIDRAPEQVKIFFDSFMSQAEMAIVTNEVLQLRNAYLDAGIVSQNYSDDALHVALATVALCQIIVSWNFKHIVHYDKIDLYNAINTKNGYNRIAICAPAEVIKYD
ncbi:MAG: hypothetical protein ACD_62C00549G0005 [uncultured bacterium]|nr:MAG: hypothetical protein ACD_62C00549G0005 [uncultured bacterium]HLD44540.1 type II toxin-antitoxin system VapC family toxin [bacterium]